MKKNFLSIILILSIVFSLGLLVACNPETDNPLNDDSYVLEIKGLTADENYVVSITKAQIKELYKTKPVTVTNDNPVYASDKQDEETGLPIPHTLKGVYLDDLLEIYAGGAVSGAFSAMTLLSNDGYTAILTNDTYSLEHGGSKMIICFEYDSINLNPKEKSGSLRAVFPNQPANSWAKKLKTIEFSSVKLNPPTPLKLNFVELLGDTYNGQFVKTETTGDTAVNVTNYGISLKKLFEGNILIAEEKDKMYLTAWDYITDGTNVNTREYANWKGYDYYCDSYLVYYKQENGGDKIPYVHSPSFDGENILKGMSVKNVLSLSVNKTALVSIETALDRYATDGSFSFNSILDLINMKDKDSAYLVSDTNGNTVTLTYDELSLATVSKTDNIYILTYNTDKTLNLKTVEIQAD